MNEIQCEVICTILLWANARPYAIKYASQIQIWLHSGIRRSLFTLQSTNDFYFLFQWLFHFGMHHNKV